eukprot:scaffold4418_cov149-Isochrysis_galbana.AAC.3
MVQWSNGLSLRLTGYRLAASRHWSGERGGRRGRRAPRRRRCPPVRVRDASSRGVCPCMQHSTRTATHNTKQ